MKKFTFPSTAVQRCVPGVGLLLTAGIAAVVGCSAPSVRADTFLPTSGTTLTWNLGSNWDTDPIVPNAIGASVLFPAPTAARTLTIDSGAAGFTVGSISFDNNAGVDNTLNTGTAGSKLILDNGGLGVTITTSGSGTGRNTFNVPIVLSDLVTAQVDQTTTSSATGSINWLSTTTGTGGFVKQGDGLATFGTGAKTYTGPTVLNGGRIRISNAARPSATSSFTINDGAQLELITAGTYAFGNGVLNLNGSGTIPGHPFSQFPGAIRNTRGLAVTIANSVVLQSDTLIHVQANAGTGGTGNPIGSTTFSNSVSGPGSLTLTAPNSDIDQGTLVLTGINTYEGGTFVNGGILEVNSDVALGAASSSLTLNGTFFSTNFLTATLRASGTISTNARTLVLGQFGNVVGGSIDTNGNDVTFGEGSTITGTTLTKIGEGKLTVAGTQTYDTLNTEGGRTDIASAVGTGDSTINANAETNISASQTLDSLTIGNGAVVALTATLPPAPEVAAGAGAQAPSASESQHASEHAGEEAVTFSKAIPEPGAAALLLSAVGVLFARRRR